MAGISASLPAPARQYRDFVRWQAELLAGPQGERLAAYWERQLAGAPRVLDLPTDRPRPPVFSQRGGAVTWRLEPNVVRPAQGAGGNRRRPHSTRRCWPRFRCSSCRYTGQEDFLIGCPFAGRSRSEFEAVVGYFVNMLPLRADLAGDPTFTALLRHVGGTVLDALEHQDYPFPLLVERLKIDRDPSRAPLVQVSFTQEKAHRSHELGAGVFSCRHPGRRLAVEASRSSSITSSSAPVSSIWKWWSKKATAPRRDASVQPAICSRPRRCERIVGHFLTIAERRRRRTQTAVSRDLPG